MYDYSCTPSKFTQETHHAAGAKRAIRGSFLLSSNSHAYIPRELRQDGKGNARRRPLVAGYYNISSEHQCFCCNRAASSVLRKSIVTVSNPTPPGTGVIWPATSF